ncbi:MAG: hypothetical protein ABSF73_10240, partial [Terriglobia bacterium]
MREYHSARLYPLLALNAKRAKGEGATKTYKIRNKEIDEESFVLVCLSFINAYEKRCREIARNYNIA